MSKPTTRQPAVDQVARERAAHDAETDDPDSALRHFGSPFPSVPCCGPIQGRRAVFKFHIGTGCTGRLSHLRIIAYRLRRLPE